MKKTYNINERIGYRQKTALYLIDIEYFQEENRDSDKSILWNCFGDIIYENLLFNLKHKPDRIFQTKRNAYKTSCNREKEINEMVEDTQKEMQDRSKVSIMDYEYSWINNLPCRKGCESDRYLLYLLLVLYKRKQKNLSEVEDQKSITDDNRSHFRIYNNARYKKITRTTLDKWIGKTITNRGLKRFIKKGLVQIVFGKDYDKIYLYLPEVSDSEPQVAFSVCDSNPMIDYYLYSEEAKIKECVICHKNFIVTGGNVKTCSQKCSRINELRNKNK